MLFMGVEIYLPRLNQILGAVVASEVGQLVQTSAPAPTRKPAMTFLMECSIAGGSARFLGGFVCLQETN